MKDTPQTAENRIKRFLVIPCLLLVLISGLAEMLGPISIYMGGGYAIAVMLTLYAESRTNTFVVTIAACAVILITLLFPHSTQPEFYTIAINHIMSLAGVMVAFVIVWYVKGIQAKAELDNKQLILLFNNATEGIILTTTSGKIVLVNPHAVNLFGYRHEDLIGKQIEVLLPADMQKTHIRQRDSFNEHPVNRPMGAGRDLYGRRKDGSVFPVEISLSHYQMGREGFVVAFIIDITIRKENEQELKQQREELERVSDRIKKMNVDLEQKMEDRTMMLQETLAQLERSKNELAAALEKEKELSDLKSRFVSTVSHEFRTPLSTILSSAALIGKYGAPQDKEKRERHIERVKENVKHMNALLEDLLSLGKLEEGLVVAKSEEVDLHKFMEDFVSEMEEIGKPGQKISYRQEGENNLFTDKRLLRNILTNLVSNAIKFSPENSVVEVQAVNSGEEVSIAVKDNGIGISKEDQENLFERFFRARNASNIQGTGLGLHIIARYVEILKGRITFQSEINEGSTFTVFIPNKKNDTP